MARVVRAFAFASGERYASLVVNLAATAVLSRLLTPAEFGVVVIGFAAAAIASGVAELGASSYLVQTAELDRAAIHSVFTINLVVTLVLASALYLCAPLAAAFYRLPALSDFLRVFALGFALLPFSASASALLTRDLAFGRKGAATLTVSVVNAAVSIALAARGFSHMSFAWAYVASNVAGAALYPLALRSFGGFGFSLDRWRPVLAFGLFGSATRLLGVGAENLTYLVIGRFLSPTGLGLLYRAGMLVTFPDRVLLGAASAVALPAFSAAVRRKESVGAAYVRTAELLMAIHWPAVATIGLLAHPIVRLFLGAQWLETATYVQIMACAALFNAPMSLNNPAQVATGAIKATPALAVFQAAVSLACIAVAAPHGPKTVAWSVWVSTPINVVASIWLVRKVAPFSRRAFLAAVARSGLVTAGAALGPVAVIGVAGTTRLGLAESAVALVLAGGGWLAALAAVRHPLLREGLGVLARFRAKSV